eukprot:scaffold37720_cov67-Phaeocystis_antarctica.AAC.27
MLIQNPDISSTAFRLQPSLSRPRLPITRLPICLPIRQTDRQFDPALLSQIDRTQVRRAGSLNTLHGTARPHRMHPAFSLHPRLRPASALIVDRSISFSTPVQPGAAPRRDPDVVRMHLAF